MRWIILFLLLSLQLNATIIYEQGSLREFIGGNEPHTSYDNYVSHISEGIVSEGYNDYGPDWVDVQTNGFGNYRIIPDEAHTLIYWRQIFNYLIQGDTTMVDDLLSDSLNTFHYDLVHFEDTDTDRSYLMLRERLNNSYIDMNQPGVPGDEVIGSFSNGWGLYIFSPQASRQQVLVEVPHPCDDFIAPYVATEMFQQSDAYALMIAGAGREVKWTGVPPYSNNKSLSDPARNANTVFQVFHEVLCDELMTLGPHSPLVLHTHSFDNNTAHANWESIVLSAGWDAGNANRPIRDRSGENLDLVNFTAEYPIAANQFGPHPDVRVDEYYRVHYDGNFQYAGAQQNYHIPHTYSLLGPITGVQMNYLRRFFSRGEVYEPWVQVELYEKPMLFQDMGMPLSQLYGGDYPTSYHNYDMLLDYYQPFIDALESYLVNWENTNDVTAPGTISNFRTELDGLSFVDLAWTPVFDANHRTYRIYMDATEITPQSPFFDGDDRWVLSDPGTSSLRISGLDPERNYVFAIEALDHFDNLSPLSPTISDSIPGHAPIHIIQDFESDTLVLGSYSDQDQHPDAWQISQDRTYPDSEHSLVLSGNTWKQEQIAPYPISQISVFQLAAYQEHVGEVQGIGFQDSLNTLFYALYGNEQQDIDQWVTVDQGYFSEDRWNVHRLPVGNDWLARFDYLPSLTSIIYINDRDLDPSAKIYFDELIDITNSIPIAPQIQIQFTYGNVYRNNQNERSVDVSFQSIVNDIDSPEHSYLWYFGDGATSTEAHPSHQYLIDDDHEYSVLLQVTDASGVTGQARTQISLEEGYGTFPLTLNFVGDIMIARRYEENGIIANGVDVIFEPTLDILGNAADLTIANLECAMTIDGTAHPTKSVVYRGHPDYVRGLAEAGIDLVSLANNHTLDYGLAGLQSTQLALEENEILYSGSGANSYEAYQPLFTNTKGVSIAWVANSDRTGQYNNYQPYLNAGYNKPGFAYLTPYYLQEQILAVRDVSDLVVVEMHAGSEYSSEPGAGYDNFQFGAGIAAEDWIAPREISVNMDHDEDVEEDENYSPFLDVPHMWDREIRHFAIDAGADLVVVHHPHIIQGVEVYNGHLIAHSLGNFVFDLNYHETFPSIILNAEVDYYGFSTYSLTPVFIDDYIPVPAQGQLAAYILDDLTRKSRALDTYLWVDREAGLASVWLDTLSMPRTQMLNRQAFDLELLNGDWLSPPLQIHRHGSLSDLTPTAGSTWEYRLGRELLWYGNMEDEGATQWDLNSNDEWLDVTEAYAGARSLGQFRLPGSGDNVVTNLEDRIRLDPTQLHQLSAWIKTVNGSDVDVEVRYYSSRTATAVLETQALTAGISGTTAWRFYHRECDPPASAEYFDIRLTSDTPVSGEAQSWFDEVSFTAWEAWSEAPALNIPTPHDYYYLQLRNSTEILNPAVEFHVMDYQDPQAVSLDFDVAEAIILMDQTAVFRDRSTGPVGWWLWDFGDGQTSMLQNPRHQYSEPGQYDITLTILDPSGAPISVTRENFVRVFSDYFPGDLNFDGQNTVSDIIVLVGIIIGEIAPSDAQLETADLNGDQQINVQDLVSLVNVILYD